ncbi:class V chitinase-like [Carya illinoinensis]|uniref:class V chitinase-like n=1 Tax=Carya illinoinensis TaxID=32201 RepID=UPI001C7180BA|nr:class V chitinase-like [Carya illinoinensis]
MTLISIEGEIANYTTLSLMVSNDSFRKSFIDSSIRIVRLYDFQGLDLCWVSANTSSDMTNMGLLFQEWRDAVNSEAKKSSQKELILTAVVHYSLDVESASFPMDSIRSYLNWVHVLAYGYHVPKWSEITGAHAALYDPSSLTQIMELAHGLIESCLQASWFWTGRCAQQLVLELWFVLSRNQVDQNQLLKTPGCSSRQDESIAAKGIKNGGRMSPHSPVEDPSVNPLAPPASGG